MGKATIASGGTDGLYTVDLDYGSEIITAQVAEIDAQIADRQADLTEAETAANDAQTALNAATNDVDNAITTYTADPTDANRLAMNAAATEAQRLAAEYRNAEARRQSLATIILSLQADKSQLQSVRTSETRQAWCVDYTEDATGEVATIEVPGEIGNLVIAPGGRAPTAADGRLVARGAQVSYQCYYNAAILPGWQRFVHPYRVGTLTAREGDSGTVDLDAATSSAAGLQVRDAETITAPIEYMTCNGLAFEVGDRVVVDTNGPTIIGFESNPRPCEPEYMIFDIRILRGVADSGDFSALTDTSSTCSGSSSQRWYDTLTISADVGSGYAVPVQQCMADATVPGYAVSCVDGLFSLWGTDHQLGSLTGLGNTHITATGEMILPEFSGAATIDGFDVFTSVNVRRLTMRWTKIFRPSGFVTKYACAPWTEPPVDHGAISVPVSGFVDVSYAGNRWSPVGYLSTDAITEWNTDSNGASSQNYFIIRTLYKRA